MAEGHAASSERLAEDFCGGYLDCQIDVKD